ncbi:MAG: glycine zipper 2TM domain-containing protein [Coxiellaceae bacterium]|nr:MAG: glycine zipper 2TM domain-containing protein [Coxiellaceae bacterium]
MISLSVGSTLLIQNTLLNPAPKQQTALPVIEPKPPVAQIVQVKPHYATTTSSRRICHPTQRIIYVQSHYYPGVGAVIGGVTGAVVGNTIINGSSRTAATIAGAAIGAVGGNAIQRNMHQPKPQVIYQNVCSKQTSSKK